MSSIIATTNPPALERKVQALKVKLQLAMLDAVAEHAAWSKKDCNLQMLAKGLNMFFLLLAQESVQINEVCASC